MNKFLLFTDAIAISLLTLGLNHTLEIKDYAGDIICSVGLAIVCTFWILHIKEEFK